MGIEDSKWGMGQFSMYVLGFIVRAARHLKRLKGSPTPQLHPFITCQAARSMLLFVPIPSN